MTEDSTKRLSLKEIHEQIRETKGDPRIEMLVVWGCRAFALLVLALLFIDLHQGMWTGVLLGIFGAAFFVAGYIDARQYYKGHLYIASQNLERMTKDLLSRDHKT